MVAKTVRVAFTNTGLDKLMSSMEKLAEQEKDLRDGIDIPLHLENETETQAQLDALAAKVEELRGIGAELPVTVTGADEASAKLDASVGSLHDLDTANLEAAASTDKLAESQAKLGDTALVTSAKTDEASKSQDDLTEKSAASGGMLSGLGGKLTGVAIGLGVVAGVSLKMAGNFDEMATTLVTGAGESEKNLDMVKSGMLAISAQTATSVDQVESGMYLIESAGFHGAEGLKVLSAAAQGAKVGNASLADVANAVTSALNSYHLSGSHAVEITNALIATTAAGKMHMDDLAKSLGNVLPIAASAHLSFAQVGGALATMTMQGMTTRRASMNLANAIRSLVSPSATASAEMSDLGLNANTISKNLGKVGLTGTLDELTEAILKNQKGGSVLASSFNQMAGPAKGLAEEILKGSISSGALATAEKALSPMQAALVTQFDKSATSATGLKQTFDGAMKTMMGGATGLNVALLLGGQNASVFSKNVGSINSALDGTGKTVTGFALVQKDLNFQMEQAKDSAKDTAISFGEALMPAVTAVMGPISHFAEFIAESSAASKIFAGIIVTVLAVALGTKLVQGFQAVASAGQAVFGMVTKIIPALGAETVATEGAEAAQDGLNLALLANPIGIIIGALVLLGVAFYELTTHCKAFRDFWIDIWKAMESAAAVTWAWLKTHWELLLAAMLSIATGGLSLVALAVYDHWHDVEVYTDDLRHDLAAIWDGISSDTASIWNTVWDNTIGRLTRGIQDAQTLMNNFKGWIGNEFSQAGNWLVDAGRNLIQGLYNGADDLIHDVGSWASKIGGEIVSAVKNFFGIHSPSTVFMGIGQNIMLGLVKGLVSNNPVNMIDKIFGGFDQAMMGMLSSGFVKVAQLPAKALSTITSWASKVGATVAGVGKSVWDDLFGGGTGGGVTAGDMSAGAIAAMWTAQGGPPGAAANMARIAMAESGDDPSIVQKGEPPGLTGYGLYQITPTSGITQGGQFGNLLNAVNNTRAAISLYHGSGYSPWTSDPVGASLTYDKGGVINEFVSGIGASGQSYTFGENGPEVVMPMSGLSGGGSNGDGGLVVNINIGYASDPDATAQSIHQILRRYKGKRGNMSLGLS